MSFEAQTDFTILSYDMYVALIWAMRIENYISKSWERAGVDALLSESVFLGSSFWDITI